MFGMGGTEILVILIVALLFLGPDKLPEAAKKISKGIRDIKKQSRVLQRTIEDDEHIGGAIRDLKSALRGEEEPVRPKPIKPPKQLVEPEADPALPEPGTPEHAGEHGAVAIAALSTTPEPAAAVADPAAPSFESPGGPVEETLRGVVAPTPSSEPTSIASSEASAMSHEPTLRGVVAPAAPDEAPKLTMPPSAGEPDEAAAATSTRADDAELAALVKPAPHTIARSSSPSPSPSPAPAPSGPAAEPADQSESKHG